MGGRAANSPTDRGQLACGAALDETDNRGELLRERGERREALRERGVAKAGERPVPSPALKGTQPSQEASVIVYAMAAESLGEGEGA